ncbi:MAG: hypothetical protein NUV67_02495 [archaeon]|nr:hypothetical protein [archaeon]
MPNVTVTVPKELKKEMEILEEVNWSAVARKAFAEKIALLRKMDKFLETSTLTEEDAVKIGKKVNEAMWKKHYGKVK